MQTPPLSAQLDQACVDLDRARRCGFPEVVYGAGKTPEVLLSIVAALLQNGIDVLATRIDRDQAQAVASVYRNARYNAVGRTLRIDHAQVAGAGTVLARSAPGPQGHVGVITAGASDLPVAEEARETLDWMGVRTTMIYDVGVAGPHRFPEQLPKLLNIDAAVVIAGMEGALPSVVGGYVACPVIAVPTSVGYGANFAGLSALLSMLNSCAANVTVVNIDAGFKGAYVAGLIAQRVARGATST